MESNKRGPEDDGQPMASKVARSEEPANRDIPDWFSPALRSKLDSLYSSSQLVNGDLDRNVLDSMRDFPAAVQLEIIDRFAETNLTTVRNKTAFLVGILKRYRSRASTAPIGRGPGSGYSNGYSMGPMAYGGPVGGDRGHGPEMGRVHVSYGAEANMQAFQLLPISVQMRLDPLYQSGVLQQSDLEANVLQSLAQFPEHVANEITAKFCESNLASVNNKTGWLVGIIKRFRAQGATTSPSNMAPGHGYPPPSSAYPPPSSYHSPPSYPPPSSYHSPSSYAPPSSYPPYGPPPGSGRAGGYSQQSMAGQGGPSMYSGGGGSYEYY